jgi:hypothetical protein
MIFWIISGRISSLGNLTAMLEAIQALGYRGFMVRKKNLELWQIWHVDFKRRGSHRADGDHRCYQIISRLVRGEKNYWVAVDTTANPPRWASFVVFDDYGREVEPGKAVSRSLSKRCLHKCLFKLRNLRETAKEKVKSGKPGFRFPLSRE